MHSVPQSLIRFIVRHTLTFLLVVAVLLAGKWVLAELQAFKSLQTDVATLTSGAQLVDVYGADQARDLASRMTAVRHASIEKLDARIGALNQNIQARPDAPWLAMLSFPLPSGSQLAERMVTSSRHAVETELLTQERDYLTQLRAAIDTGLNQKAAYEKLERLRLEHVAAYQALQASARQLEEIKQQSPLKAHLPGTFEYRKFSVLSETHQKLRDRNALAYQAFQVQKTAAGRAATIQAVAQFSVNQVRIDAAMKPLRDSLAQGKAASAQNWFARASDPVMAVVPTAALVVLSMLLTPFLIKLVFYFVLAPLAARLGAIFVDRRASGALTTPAGSAKPGTDGPRISAVSQTVTIGRDDELLVHADYLQSASVGGSKDTKWILDWSCPLTSMAAGLVALTRIRTDQTESVVISSTDDPLSEIALLSLPEGAALVFQPRGLIGVVYRHNQPLTITRHWRLGSLHGWLTLQLRYLVFRGPVTLIVKGCRGVKVEAAGNGRSISQSATLGFSANLAYSTIRCETFFPYLTGKQALFQDRFDGPSGFYVYEETPGAGKRSGIAGRGLAGLTDSVLKVFGI